MRAAGVHGGGKWHVIVLEEVYGTVWSGGASAIGLDESFTGPIEDDAIGLPDFPDRLERVFSGPW